MDSSRGLGHSPGVESGQDTEVGLERLVLELGRALHRYGTPAHRLESVLEKLAGELGLEVRVFVVPTAIFAAFGPLGSQRSDLVRVEPGDVDLGKLAKLDEVVKNLARQALPLPEALAAVRAVDEEAPPYPKGAIALGFGVAACAGVQVFGGGWAELPPAGGLGLLLGGLALATAGGAGRHLLVPIAATTAAALAQLGQAWFGPYASDIVTAAGLLVLLPGLTLTIALTELATRHLVSGTARLTVAVLILLELGFGLVFGERLGRLWVGPDAGTPPIPLPAWTQPWAVLGAALAFVVIFRARLRDALPIVIACALSFFGAKLSTALFGGLVGTWVAAVGLAMACNLYARRWDQPATIPLVPAILLLVPGSVGLRSMRFWLEHNPMRALDGAQEMIGIGLALAVGILAANVLLPPRRSI